MIKKLLQYVGEYKKDSILTPIYIIGEVFMDILIPFVTASIIDKGIEAGDMSKVYQYGAIMLILAFLSLFFGIRAGKIAARASAGFASNLREGMYENIQTFSFSNIDKFSTAGLVTRMTTDVTNVQNAYQMIIRITVRAPLMLICSMIMCFVINAKLSLIFLCVLILLGFALGFIIKCAMPVFNEVFSKYDDLNASVQENVTGIRVVKAFVREDFENKKFGKASEVLYKMFVKAESYLAFNNPVMMVAIYGCMLTLSWLSAHYIVGGTMTTGNLTSLFSYVMGMMMSLMMISMIFVMLSMSTASAKRIAEVLNEKADITNPETPVMEVKNGDIDFNNVNFAYKHGSGEETLENIDLHIHSGETIGIIGGTGSGKSSLVNLIPRFYDVSNGTVRVQGHDVKEYPVDVLRDKIGVVMQKAVLFQGTIAENLKWGKTDATEEEMWKALEIAQAMDVVKGKEGGLSYELEQGGKNLSGGQKQRLTIARAVVKDPDILILDDSASALDFATDAKLRAVLKNMHGDKTIFIVSQRTSSIQFADKIIVLDDGKIAGMGTHDELLTSCDTYREIYDSQFKKEEKKEAV